MGYRFREAVVLRTVLAAVVAMDLLSFYWFLGDARANALANGIAFNGFNDLLSHPAVRGAVILIGITGAITFGRRPGRLWHGVVALGALTVLSTAHAQLFGSPWRHLFFSGLCLLGWLLGLAVGRQQGAPTDESYARVGSIALLGAAYLNSGISKVVYGGAAWLSGVPIQVAIIGQDGLVADGTVSTYRFWVATTPAMASVLSIATVGFELAGPLMLVGRRTRRCVALGLVAMHLSIYLLTTHILYWESMLLLAVFGLASDDSLSIPVSDTLAARRSHDRAFVGSATLLAVCALLAIGHQGRRYAQSRGAGTRGGEGPPLVPAPAPLRQVGPFAVGQTLADEWSVEALDLSDGGFVVALSGKPGRARFELTCAASPHRSPFDIGGAHIFFSSDLELSDLEPVGRAVRERVRQTAEGQDVCGRLLSWRTAARPAPR